MSERITVTLTADEAQRVLIAYVEQKHGTLKDASLRMQFNGFAVGPPGLAVESFTVTGLKS